MIRTPEDLAALYEAEQSEKEGVQARQELLHLLTVPGFVRFKEWLSHRRNHAFEQLRSVQGPAQVVAESFWKWQAIDALYEDIEAFIKNSIEFGEDILRRERSELEEQYLRQEIFSEQTRSYSPNQSGASSGSDSAGGSSSTASSY